MRIPEGFVEVRGAGARGFARPDADDWVRDQLVRWGSLARAAAHAPDALPLTGRGPVHAVPAPEEGRWVVRRYRRGGWMAPVLNDRYLRRGASRPLRETLASEAARARGIPTPRIVAGMVYPSGLFYRADLVNEWIPGTRDLATLLFSLEAAPEVSAGPPDRRALLAAAGALVARLARAGIRHRDLNAKNLLVDRRGDPHQPRLLVLDLDRATVHEPGSLTTHAMSARLTRSLRKFERGTGRTLPASAWDALARGLETGVETW